MLRKNMHSLNPLEVVLAFSFLLILYLKMIGINMLEDLEKDS